MSTWLPIKPNIASGPRAGSAWNGLALGAPEPPGGNTGRGGRHRRRVCHVWRNGGGLLAQWCSKHVGSKNACSRLVRPGDKQEPLLAASPFQGESAR